MSGPCILNGFGRSLGDGVIGLQALNIAIEEGRFDTKPALARLPGLPAVLQQLYTLCGDIADVVSLDWKYEKRGPRPPFCAQYEDVIDLRDFAFDRAFRGISMIDFFLGKLGIDPVRIPSDRKRNSWLAPRVASSPNNTKKGYVLLCPTASMQIRCMPPPFHDAILTWLTENLDVPVYTQAVLPPEPTLAGLCALVAAARCIVSTDTAMVHLADAFSVPCLAFFPTHRPEWRSRDYPFCRNVFLSAKLPPALEFARGSADVEIARAAWFPNGANLEWLKRILAETVIDLGLGMVCDRSQHRKGGVRCTPQRRPEARSTVRHYMPRWN
jgi:hypothetical protein